MQNSKLYYIIFLFIFSISDLCKLFAQTSKFSYQVILETKGEYNEIDKKSEVNPDNQMELNDFNSVNQLYPILTFSDFSDKINTTLQIEANIKNNNFEKEQTDFSFQELYGQFSLKDRYYLVFGKKRLDWGAGMIWNPTNFFVQKDPLRTQNRLEGIFMLNYTYLFKNHSFNFYVFPEKKKEDCSFALKYDYSENRVNAGLSFVEYRKYQQFGYEFSYGGNQFTAYSEGVLKNYSKIYRVDKNGNLTEPSSLRKKFQGEFVAGAMILLSNRLTFSGEYQFREDALNKNEIHGYEKQLPANPPVFDPISMGQHTLFGNIEYKDIYGRWSVNLRSFYDPISDQLLISPLGIITRDNFQIELSAMFYNSSWDIYHFQSSLLISYFF